MAPLAMGIAEIAGALAVIVLAVLRIGLTADEPGLADGDIELVLADQPAKRQRRIDIAAGRIHDDRQFPAAKRLERAFEQRRRPGFYRAFGRYPFRADRLAARRIAADDDKPHRRTKIRGRIRREGSMVPRQAKPAGQISRSDHHARRCQTAPWNHLNKPLDATYTSRGPKACNRVGDDRRTPTLAWANEKGRPEGPPFPFRT